MVERNPTQRERFRRRAEAIAVRFSKEDTPRGWGAIDNLEIPLYVTAIDKRLVYVLSSTLWSEVESALKDQNIPYEYQRASSLSRKNLAEPDKWNKIEHTKPQEGSVTNG